MLLCTLSKWSYLNLFIFADSILSSSLFEVQYALKDYKNTDVTPHTMIAKYTLS